MLKYNLYCVPKGYMKKYLLMSMNLGIWNLKHDFP